MSIRATLTVADDVLTSINGKADLRGVYPTDIAIHGDSAVVGQLVFIFNFEGEPAELPRVFRYEVQLPGEEVRTMVRPVPTGWRIPEERDKWAGMTPFPIGPVVLRPGEIKAALILDDQRFELAAPWIISLPTASQQPSEQSQNAEP